MSQVLALVILGCLAGVRAEAQETKPAKDRTADFTLGLGNGMTNLSLSYQFGWRLTKNQKLRIGVGGRFNQFFASDKYFVTAPASIVKGSAAVLFKEPIKENMDSLYLSASPTSSLNLLIHISYDFAAKMRFGFNIDVIGVSFGGGSPGTYINGNAPDGIYTKPVNASPSTFNLLLIGENDLGSLNSEFFVAYSLNQKWTLKGGVQHIFIEYTTETKVQQFPEPNDRFRITPTIACLGVVYTLP